MKKQRIQKKLTLSRETFYRLSERGLHEVAGGVTITICDYTCYSCEGSCHCSAAAGTCNTNCC